MKATGCSLFARVLPSGRLMLATGNSLTLGPCCFGADVSKLHPNLVLLYWPLLLLAVLLGALRDSALQTRPSLQRTGRKRDVKALGWRWN
jgi:hypothetical protein